VQEHAAVDAADAVGPQQPAQGRPGGGVRVGVLDVDELDVGVDADVAEVAVVEVVLGNVAGAQLEVVLVVGRTAEERVDAVEQAGRVAIARDRLGERPSALEAQ
jgi:hypothetical protein